MRLPINYLRYSVLLIVTLLFTNPSQSQAAYCSDCFSWDCGCGPEKPVETITFLDPMQYQDSNSECCTVKKNEDSCNESCCFWGYFDLLYWKALQSETDFVVKDVPITTNVNSGYVGQIGCLQDTEFDWNTGFRLGGVFCLDCDWELEANYTKYCGSGCEVVDAKNGCYLNGTFEDLTDTDMSKAKSKISLDYRLWNVLAAKKLCVDSCLDLRLSMGLSHLNLEQDWKFTYYGTSRNDYDLSWHFTGIGVRAGVDATWAFCGNWSLLGKFSTALFCGDYKNKGEMSVSGGIQTTVAKAYDYKLSDSRLVPHYQVVIGPQYKIKCWGWPITAYALYEMNAYQNVHYVFQSEFGIPESAKESRHSSSLTGFHGLTLGLYFEF